MTITVLLFAQHAAALGEKRLTLELSRGATVGDALRRLGELHPGLSVDRSRLATAVNLEYVGSDRLLSDGDELALIGPVSGG